jgi:peroxiredoxin Q/BCP
MYSPGLGLSAFGLVAALLASAGAPAGADDAKDGAKVELKVGDAAPGFEARTDADTTWVSADHYKKQWVVIYFYPGDFTPGCTAQARAFAAAMDKLTEKGVEVIGVSGDSVETHALFKKAQKLNFTLLADGEGALAKKYGVPVGPGADVKARDPEGKLFTFKRNATLARWTFVVGKDGKIAYVNTKVTPADDAKKITEFITKAEQK